MSAIAFVIGQIGVARTVIFRTIPTTTRIQTTQIETIETRRSRSRKGTNTQGCENMLMTSRLRWHRIARVALTLSLAATWGSTAPRSTLAETPAGVARVRSAATVPPVTAAEVRPHIEFLASPALQGRGGPQRAIAAKYLRDRFEELGLEPLFADDSYDQPIPGANRAADADPPVIGINVGGWIPGSDPKLKDEFVIISAHYDHLGVRGGEVYPGADDNASGVAMMLETAREIAAMTVKPRRSLVFVGFDLEEEMLWGSRWFASHPPWPLDRLKLFITADMIGRSLGNLDLPTVFVLGSERAPHLQTVLDETPVPEGLELARLGIDLIGTRSDYGPFRDRKIPFLFFSTGQHGDYHTPRDVAELIDYEKVARVSRVVLSIAVLVADSDDAPEWSDEVAPDLAEASAIHRITELVLEADRTGERSINGLQRFFVSQVYAKTGNAIRLGRLTGAERQWLTRSSQLLLLSVF